MKVAHSCLTLCDPIDSTVHGILQARILEWVAFPFSMGSSQSTSPTFQVDFLLSEPCWRILEWVAYPFSRESSQPKDRTQVSPIAGEFFITWATIHQRSNYISFGTILRLKSWLSSFHRFIKVENLMGTSLGQGSGHWRGYVHVASWLSLTCWMFALQLRLVWNSLICCAIIQVFMKSFLLLNFNNLGYR